MQANGKRLLITGGGKRIGAAIARRMAAAGCRIALHCRNSISEAEQLLADLPGSGHTLHIADFTIPGAASKLFSEVGSFEYLVNNAAIFYRPGSAEDTAAAQLYNLINFTVPAELLKLFSDTAPAGGAAVNMLDCFALNPGSGAYWQSKRSLLELTEALAVPWGEKNLRINGVAPGAVLPPPWAPESQMTHILAQTPLHRATTPDEIARLVQLLLTCQSISGAIIPIDGALHLTSFREKRSKTRKANLVTFFPERK